MSRQFTFRGRYRPHSLQVAQMDQNQHRNYSTSEQLTYLGRHQTDSLQEVNMDHHQHGNYVTSEQFTHLGRNFNLRNSSLAQARGYVRPHYHSNPKSWSNVHHGYSFSLESPCYGQTSSSPHNVVPHLFTGYDSGSHGIDSSTVPVRFPFKRKSPDVPMVFDQGNSTQGPFKGIYSMLGLLDKQFDDNQYSSQYSTSFHQYSKGDYLDTLNDSRRNVRSRYGPNLAPTLITSQHVHTTNILETHNVVINNPHNNDNAYVAWNLNYSSNVHGRTISGTNGVIGEAYQHGVEAGQYNYSAITDRDVMPPSQYVEVYENSIRPRTSSTQTWGSNSLSSRENTRLVSNRYEVASNYHLQRPTETYSLRYPWSPSTQMSHPSYQNDRAREVVDRYSSLTRMDRNERAPWNDFYVRFRLRARYGYDATSSNHRLQFPIEQYSSRYSGSYTTTTGLRTYRRYSDRSTPDNFLPPASAMNRNESMETQHVIQDDMFTNFPRPRGADVMQSDMFAYFPPPRDTFVHDEYEAMRLDIENMSYEELLALEELIGNVETGLSDDKILNCLVEYSDYDSEQNKDDNICPICMDDSNMDKVMKLRSCGHDFHLQCITKWLEIKNACPMCKRSVVSNP